MGSGQRGQMEKEAQQEGKELGLGGETGRKRWGKGQGREE